MLSSTQELITGSMRLSIASSNKLNMLYTVTSCSICLLLQARNEHCANHKHRQFSVIFWRDHDESQVATECTAISLTLEHPLTACWCVPTCFWPMVCGCFPSISHVRVRRSVHTYIHTDIQTYIHHVHVYVYCGHTTRDPLNISRGIIHALPIHLHCNPGHSNIALVRPAGKEESQEPEVGNSANPRRSRAAWLAFIA